MSEESNSSNPDLFADVCDDMCEQILEYLPFNDKIKLEGVSKQWQTCMFRQQTVLKIDHSHPPQEDDNSLNKLLKPIESCDYLTEIANSNGWKQIKKLEFENTLKRCPFIKSVVLLCFSDDNDLQLIGKYLERLETLVLKLYCITKNGLLEFGRNYGHRLRALRFDVLQYNSENIKMFLNYCPNIEVINFADSSAYYSEDKDFLPKLEEIYGIKVRSERDIENIKGLKEKYAKTMKILYITVKRFGVIAMQYINSFVNLEKLVFNLNDSHIENNQIIANQLIQLSEHCSQLYDFKFVWLDNDRRLSENFFQTFSKFYSIETIDIRLIGSAKVIQCKSEYFKSCTNLKHLRLSYEHMRETFFKNIGQHLPNLQSIDLNTEKAISNESLISLSALKKLKKVWLRQHQIANEFITDSGIRELINSCTNIEDIWFGSTPKITNETIDYLIAIAKQRTRKVIKFRCGLSESRDELQYDEQIDINRLNELPNNLNIDILVDETVDEEIFEFF